MEAAPAANPVPTASFKAPSFRPPEPGAPSRPADLASLVGSALAHLAGASALLAALAGAYTAKRRLGIDIFPGVDVLPDPEIEAWIDAMVDLLGW